MTPLGTLVPNVVAPPLQPTISKDQSDRGGDMIYYSALSTTLLHTVAIIRYPVELVTSISQFCRQ